MRSAEENDLPELPEYCAAQDIKMDSAELYEYEDDGKKTVYHMHITLEYLEERI